MNVRRLTGYISRRSPLPEGSLTVGVGLVTAGLTTYGFLVICGRILGAGRFAELSALWSLIFLVGPGLFLPFEQEASRAVAARRSRGEGGGPAIKRIFQVGLVVLGVLLILSLLTGNLLIDELFGGQSLLLVSFVVALVGFATQFPVRGVLSGTGQFRRYGLVIGSEGAVRLLACVLLAIAGAKSVGPYALALGMAPLVGTGLALLRPRERLLLPGPPASLKEVSGALGYLLAGSLFSQSLIMAGPLAVKLLASESEEAAAGRFLAGLIVARVPIFLYQAIQAAMLPKLSRHVATRRHADFKSGLARLLVAVCLIGGFATVATVIVGPWIVRVLFGPGFEMTRTDLGLLAGGSAAYLIAVTFAQALIALSEYSKVAIAWAVAVVCFGAATALGSGLIFRVEVGFLVGAVAAALAMGILLIPRLNAFKTHSIDELVDASHQVHLEP